MSFETACPFTGCCAHSALMGDGDTSSFCLLIPQTQQSSNCVQDLMNHIAFSCPLVPRIQKYEHIIQTRSSMGKQLHFKTASKVIILWKRKLNIRVAQSHTAIKWRTVFTPKSPENNSILFLRIKQHKTNMKTKIKTSVSTFKNKNTG
jgi:hypothetical protein